LQHFQLLCTSFFFSYSRIPHPNQSSPNCDNRSAINTDLIAETEFNKEIELDEEKKIVSIPLEVQVETINLGTEEEPRLIKVAAIPNEEERRRWVQFLREYESVFAWSYRDMPGLDPEIAKHTLPIKPDCKPVKQKLRRMKPELAAKVKEEIDKQLEAGFIQPIDYTEWLANIVVVPKKDGRIRICVDYRDLNAASPKDDFPLPHIDVLVDQAAMHAVYSFMDGYSGYNQILMDPEDKSKTAFTTP
jgi:hypothetical protein